jgi:exonuclease SbcD
MKFIHMADCHLGGWREPKLRDISNAAFTMAVDRCIKEEVDFILISGDLFNTALPAIENIKLAVEQLKKLKDFHIPVYTIEGSHDMSPSGKTILDVFESAGLTINVVKGEPDESGKLKLKFTEDLNTGIKITGLIGKKGGLEKSYYYNLARENLESEKGYKIFMFHTALSEMKTKELEKMDAMPVSMLPRGFNYYAGGHVHIVDKKDFEGYQNVVYPGPIWPNSFAELEKLGCGGFVLVTNEKAEQTVLEPNAVVSVRIDADGKNPAEAEQEIIDGFKGTNIKGAVITIRVNGELRKGKITDINFKKIFEALYEQGAYFVMKNTEKLTSKEFEEVKINENTAEEIEEKLIQEHSGQLKIYEKEKEMRLTKELLLQMGAEKQEGEKNMDFEKRVQSEIDTVLNIL